MITRPLLDLAAWVARLGELEIPICRDTAEGIAEMIEDDDRASGVAIGRLAQRDPLLERLQTLCAQAQPPVALTVHSEAQGQRLTPQALQTEPGPLDIWFCGPQGLGDALHEHARGLSRWRLHRESFALR